MKKILAAAILGLAFAANAANIEIEGLNAKKSMSRYPSRSRLNASP
ncbi:hypothetical protein [uncultured Campylobacter sp.]|nr:hypothetical protein [uncultured Campylobacter sp.]